MRWIWQQSDWPDLRYDKRTLEDRDIAFRIISERLAGRFESLPMAYQKDATIDLMLSEAIKTSDIEGEELDRIEIWFSESIRRDSMYTYFRRSLKSSPIISDQDQCK